MLRLYHKKTIVTDWNCSSLSPGWVNAALEGVNFKGNDIRFELTDDAASCQKTCNEDPNCQFYNYLKADFPDSVFRYINLHACIKTCIKTNFYFLSKIVPTVQDIFKKLLLILCSRRRCYLKRSITMPYPPRVAKLATAVSGFQLRNCV